MSNWFLFLAPFTCELWICIIGVQFLLCLLLYASYNLDQVISIAEEDTGRRRRIYSFYNSMFYVYGAFCQQGSYLILSIRNKHRLYDALKFKYYYIRRFVLTDNTHTSTEIHSNSFKQAICNFLVMM